MAIQLRMTRPVFVRDPAFEEQYLQERFDPYRIGYTARALVFGSILKSTFRQWLRCHTTYCRGPPPHETPQFGPGSRADGSPPQRAFLSASKAQTRGVRD